MRTRAELKPCPKCGMYSGERLHSGDVQELFRIKCMTCGHKTNWYKTLSYASRAWNKEGRDV